MKAETVGCKMSTKYWQILGDKIKYFTLTIIEREVKMLQSYFKILWLQIYLQI